MPREESAHHRRSASAPGRGRSPGLTFPVPDTGPGSGMELARCCCRATGEGVLGVRTRGDRNARLRAREVRPGGRNAHFGRFLALEITRRPPEEHAHVVRFTICPRLSKKWPTTAQTGSSAYF